MEMTYTDGPWENSTKRHVRKNFLEVDHCIVTRANLA